MNFTPSALLAYTSAAYTTTILSFNNQYVYLSTSYTLELQC